MPSMLKSPPPFKIELIYGQGYLTRSEAQIAVFDYIEFFYNRMRLHSSLANKHRRGLNELLKVGVYFFEARSDSGHIV